MSVSEFTAGTGVLGGSAVAGKAHAVARPLAVASLMLVLGYAVLLIGLLLQGYWLLDQQGQPIASDFVNVWSAGQLTLQGQPAAAYDWLLHKAAEVRAVGHEFENYYGWHYPPVFLFVAALLALVPFVPASLLWLGLTMAGYLATMRVIIGERLGILLGLAFPAGLWNITAGQNGFLTASLIGGSLALMQHSPILSGVCLGLLTYKPQFGLLFPFALAAGGRWRVMAAAAVTSIFLMLLSWIVFGTAPWVEFVDGLGRTKEAILSQGLAEFARLQSVFGFVRAQGGSETLAYLLQAGITLASATIVWSLWRSQAAYDLKAAGLGCAALLATPYIYMYDLVALAIPLAFLLRLAFRDKLRPLEVVGLGGVTLLILLFVYAKTQVGLFAILIVAALLAMRWISSPIPASASTRC
jgi:hypothetical protein